MRLKRAAATEHVAVDLMAILQGTVCARSARLRANPDADAREQIADVRLAIVTGSAGLVRVAITQGALTTRREARVRAALVFLAAGSKRCERERERERKNQPPAHE